MPDGTQDPAEPYEDAWREWEAGEAAAWETTIGDGLRDTGE